MSARAPQRPTKQKPSGDRLLKDPRGRIYKAATLTGRWLRRMNTGYGRRAEKRLIMETAQRYGWKGKSYRKAVKFLRMVETGRQCDAGVAGA